MPPQPVQLFWIDVKDHLPDDEMTVLFHSADGETFVGFRESGEWFDATSAIHPVAFVTHWADLPTPPKTGELPMLRSEFGRHLPPADGCPCCDGKEWDCIPDSTVNQCVNCGHKWE